MQSKKTETDKGQKSLLLVQYKELEKRLSKVKENQGYLELRVLRSGASRIKVDEDAKDMYDTEEKEIIKELLSVSEKLRNLSKGAQKNKYITKIQKLLPRFIALNGFDKPGPAPYGAHFRNFKSH